MGGLIKNNKILHYIRRTKSSDLHLLCQVVGTNASEHRNSALPLVFFWWPQQWGINHSAVHRIIGSKQRSLQRELDFEVGVQTHHDVLN